MKTHKIGIDCWCLNKTQEDSSYIEMELWRYMIDIDFLYIRYTFLSSKHNLKDIPSRLHCMIIFDRMCWSESYRSHPLYMLYINSDFHLDKLNREECILSCMLKQMLKSSRLCMQNIQQHYTRYN